MKVSELQGGGSGSRPGRVLLCAFGPGSGPGRSLRDVIVSRHEPESVGLNPASEATL